MSTASPTSRQGTSPEGLTRAGGLRSRFRTGFDGPVLGFVIFVHAIPLALCLFFFSWPGLWLLLGLYVLTGLGVTIGYHRKYFSHRQQKMRTLFRQRT